jgi:GT2 family glycosyltransferase
VIVCTHNRSRLLARCIDSVVRQLRPEFDVEILVVDNASTDDTAAVVQRAHEGCSAVRYVFEPVLGLSHARNRGIGEARGDILMFTDDDATVNDGWLAETLAGFEAPGTSAVGGPIRLDVEGPWPRWMGPGVTTMFSHLDLGDARRPLSSREGPFGTNMAVRRDVAETLGGFRADLGRVGAKLISDEEFEFFVRLERHGGSITYLPDAVVTHAVPAERARLGWLLRRAFAQGRSHARLHQHLAADGWSWFDGRIPSAFSRCALRGWRLLARNLARGPDRRAELVVELTRRVSALGFAFELVRLRLRRTA